MRRYRITLLVISFLIFQFTVSHLAFGQANIEESLNIKIDDSLRFRYNGSQKDDVGNTEYYFQSSYESENTYYDLILNVMDPVYYNTDTEILKMIRENDMEGTEFEGLKQRRVKRGNKILFEYPAVESLADDNQMWQLKTGCFVYKERLYWLFVGSREKQANRLYELVLNGIELL